MSSVLRKFAMADIWIGHDDMKHCRLRRSDPVFGEARRKRFHQAHVEKATIESK